MTTITALPTAPSRADPNTFSARGDAFVAALPQLVTEINTVSGEVNTYSTNAVSSASTASSQATAAATSATNAANSATAAATSSTSSSTSATASSNSATAAATSATNAANSATAAATSATNAANSAASINLSSPGAIGNGTPSTGAFTTLSTTGALSVGGALNEAASTTIASSATLNLTSATSNLVDVSGTTTITAITLASGAERTVRFTGILTLTNSASLILPGGANITTASGDFAVFSGYASGVVRCVVYTKANGNPIVSPASSGTGTGTLTNLTASRAFATTYTNTGSTTRWVIVYSNIPSATGTTHQLYANSSGAGTVAFSVHVTDPVYSKVHGISFPVQAGGSYTVSVTSPDTLQSWYEYQ
jgi:hypothetical protein